MILDKEKFIDRLFWFNYFKREYLRYMVTGKRNRLKSGKANVSFFASMTVEYDKMNELRQSVLSEMDKNRAELSKKEMTIVLTYMQSSLDTIYDEFDKIYSRGEEYMVHPIIPSIQNEIRRRAFAVKGPAKKDLTFDKWFPDKSDIKIAVDALIRAGVINSECEYLKKGNPKFAITAWVKVLSDRNYVNQCGDDSVALIIPEKIKNFKIAGRSLRSTPQDPAYTNYLNVFRNLIPRKK